MKKSLIGQNNNPHNTLFFLVLLLFIFFAFPRGIGINVFGSVIDIVEISQAMLFLYILPKIELRNLEEKIFLSSIVLLPALGIFFYPEYFPSNFIRLFFFILFIFSGYFLGKYLYHKFVNNKILFLKTIIYSNFICLVLALINFNIEIFPIDSFRTYDQETLDEISGKQRMITGLEEIGFAAFRGNQMASNEFAIIQSMIFSITTSCYFFMYKKLSRNSKLILLLSIFLSLYAIVLSQSRGVFLICFLLIFYLSIKEFFKKKTTMKLYYNPLVLLGASSFIFVLAQPQIFLFFITNISTLLNYLNVEGYGGVVITEGETSRRVQALQLLIPTILSNPEVLIYGFGEGFWNFHSNSQLGLFSDSGILITYLLEYGIIPWLVFFIFIYIHFKKGIKSKSDFILVIILSLFTGILASSITSFKTAYWYIFLLLGIITEHNYFNENRHNHNSI